MRRNYRRNRGFFGKLFRKNPGELLTAGLFGFLGFAGAKFAGNLIAKGIAKLAGGSAPPAAIVAPAPASGFGSIDAMASPIGALIAGGIGIFATMKFVTDPQKREALLTGTVVSMLHSVAMAALGAISPGAKAVLSGDDTAVRLAAMYGMGGGTSIMPHYAQINGYGEYVAQSGYGALPSYVAQAGMRGGTGEYYPGVQGMGEYFESGVEGLGNYVGNVELQQAAAGYGAGETMNTNHIDPSSDLDRELTIAEAAAGIGGGVYQAAAGMGEYFAANGMQGFGNVGVAPSADTWIPGTSNPQLWAGTRPVTNDQEATAMVPAGVLSNGGGGQGVLG
jgi:hypothetical protein